MIVVSCTCGERFKAKAEHAGKRTKCPACGSAIRIPSEERERREVHSARPHFVDSVAEALPVEEVLTLEGAPILGPRQWESVLAIHADNVTETTTSARYGLFGWMMPPPRRVLLRTLLLSEVGQIDVANRLDPRWWVILLLALGIAAMVISVPTFFASIAVLVLMAFGELGRVQVTFAGTLGRMVGAAALFSLCLLLILYLVHNFRLISVVVHRKRSGMTIPLAVATGANRPLGVRFPGVEQEEALALGEAFSMTLAQRCSAAKDLNGARN